MVLKTRHQYGVDDRQVIEIYKPTVQKAPAMYYVHGGAWISSSINDFEFIGHRLASNGIICVMAEYRLTDKANPTVIHPMHCDDVSNGLKYTIDLLQKDPSWNGELAIGGHSAGAFMTGYILNNLNINIKCWIGIEGIYDIKRIAEMYPKYVNWFLIHAFPQRNEWAQLTIKHGHATFLLHSKQDELIDFEHVQEFKSDEMELIELQGTHDGVLQTDLFFETLVRIIKC